MEQAYLIDTNVIIDNLGNKLPEKAKELLTRSNLLYLPLQRLKY
jgi:hypothetical protein